MLGQNLHYIQLLIPALCSGSLFFGLVLFTYIYYRDRNKLYLSMIFLALCAFVFVSSEMMLLIQGALMLNSSSGMQFHRLEQLAGVFFIPSLSYFIYIFFNFTPRVQRVNYWIVFTGSIVAVIIFSVAFIYPNSFISTSEHTAKWLDHVADFGRGKEGFLYYLRDGLLGFLILYCISCFIIEMKRYKGFRYTLFPFVGLLFAFFGAIDDTLYVHLGTYSGLLGQTYYSKFSLGVTVFIMLSMAGSIRRFVDQAKEVEDSYSRVNSAFRALNNSQQRFRQLAENINEVFMLYDYNNKVFLYISPAFERVWGYSPDILHEQPEYWLEQVHCEDQKVAMQALEPDVDRNRLELEYRIFYGEEVRWVRDQIFLIRDKNGNVYRLARILEDITDRKKNENELAYLAYHDTLTGLPNRRSFFERFKDIVIQSQREEEKQAKAAFFIDLDQFKKINDTHGHSFGDKLLKVVAGRLQTCLRESDYIFRFSGDEFTVLLNHIAQDLDAANVANKIIEHVTEPYVIEGKEVYIGISIGISIFPKDGNDPELLFKNADIALFEAKNQGNSYRFFDTEMNKRALEKITIENDLRHAIAKDQFEMHYQPIVSKTGAIVACESLIRWRHPKLGFIPPFRFIPIAESSGLIVELGEWILRTVFKQVMEWRKSGYDIRVGINLSARQFADKGLLNVISGMLETTEIDPQQVEFEITESSIMEKPDECITIIESLRSKGFHMAVDDFGTGYSSLSYLQRFRITHLKIDKSFIDDIHFDENNREITRTIIDLAHNLNMKVIAEGIEEESQESILHDLGCDELQGYLFSKPLSKEDFQKYLSKSNESHA